MSPKDLDFLLPDLVKRNPEIPDEVIAEMLEDAEIQDLVADAFTTKLPPGLAFRRVMAKGVLLDKGIIVHIETPIEKAKKARKKKAEGFVGRDDATDLPVIASAKALLSPFSGKKVVPSRWLHRGRILDGALNLFLGDPGVGKSTVLGDYITRISTGATWPDSGERVDPGSVVIINREEDECGDILPRLLAMGANMDRVINYEGQVKGTKQSATLKFSTDLDVVKSIIEQVPDLRMLVLDPITVCFQGSETKSGTEIGDALMPVLRLAQEKRFAVVGVIHFNKDLDKPLIYRAADSAALMQIARMAWLVSEHPDDLLDHRAVTLVKGNPPDRIRTGLSFRFVDGKVKWDKKSVPFLASQVDVALQKMRQKSGDVLLAKKWGTQKARAMRYVLGLLVSGEITQEDVWDRSEASGHGKSTIRRAISALLSDEHGDPQIERYSKMTKLGERLFLKRREVKAKGGPLVLMTDLLRWRLPHETVRAPKCAAPVSIGARFNPYVPTT
jgi:AAA domain